MRIAINQITADTTATVPFLAATRAAGIDEVSLWRHRFLDASAAKTAIAVRDHGLTVSSLCRGGFFTGPAPATDNLVAVEEAAALGAPILVLVCGPAADGAAAAIRRGIEVLLPAAADAGVTLAVEPFHPMYLAERSAVVTIDQGLALVEEFAHPSLALAVDTYHVWWDPTLHTQIERAAGHIAAVHVSDWLVPTTDLVAQRGLPGDGVIPIADILARIHRTGFTGPVEAEVVNPEVWARPVGDLTRDIHTRMAALALP
jgi:sugar phosphate isomerase/epimerase